MPNLSTTRSTKIYSNDGNALLMEMLDSSCLIVLDVGCGAGDNARLSRELGFNRKFYGITISPSEREIASGLMEDCWVDDVETSSLDCIKGQMFDAIVFSHILEHLREPASVVSKFLPFLKSNGKVLVAVPNVALWRQRLQFLAGRFDYEEEGVLDNTHLRFFTYYSADKYLLNDHELRLVEKKVEGSVPLWLLRRRILPRNICAFLDARGGAIFPNLFGGQVLLKAEKCS